MTKNEADLRDALQKSSPRRSFLAQSALGAATALLASCDRTSSNERAPVATDQDSASQAHAVANINNDDAAPTRTLTAGAPYRRYDPALPPAATSRNVKIAMTAREMNVYISHDVVVPAWTFNGTVPGPVVHVRVGDTIEFTLTNEHGVPHSMDFHAAQINPKTAFRSVPKGESISYTFTPKYAGAFMYHCGTQPVLMHIGNGMYGAIIVDPVTPLPTAKEFVLVQSEFYVGRDAKGAPQLDYKRMLTTMPDYVVFNGIAAQYQADPIVVKRGDRVRFYVVSAGPTHACAFHIVGEQFDTVYLGAPPGNPIRGVQTFAVPAGGGMVFELDADVVGEFPFVNHGFGHGQIGAIGVLVVET